MPDTIVLIHGTNGSHEETRPLAACLPREMRVLAPNWLGHGGRPAPEEDYGLDTIVADLIASLDAAGVERAFLFGYSIGGYAAMMLAQRHPERVRGIVSLATRHIWHPAAVAHLVYLADPARLTRPGNRRGAQLGLIHHPADWRIVNDANRALFARLGENAPLSDADIATIAAPSLVLNGTRDPLVPLAESEALARLFPIWRLATFPGSAHPFDVLPHAAVAETIAGFVRDVTALERAQAVAAA